MTSERIQEFAADFPGERLDHFLARNLSGYSRAAATDLIKRGCVRVGGDPCRPDRRLKVEELVAVSFPQGLWPGEENFEDWILHEDKDLLVLRKPAGLLMHPLGMSWLSIPEAASTDAEPNLAGILFRVRPQILKAGVERVGLVHRLDRETSGVLLVAKTAEAQQNLLDAFRERRVQKTYRAVVRGRLEKRATRVDAPVGTVPGRRKIQVSPFGKEAQTALKTVELGPAASLVEAKPLTGRTHQIRAHLALIGHPVAGDREFDSPQAVPRPPRLMLHALRISFAHPKTGRPAEFKADPPPDFKAFWKECEKGGGKP